MNNENIKFCLDDKCKNCAYIKPKPFYQTPSTYRDSNGIMHKDDSYVGWVVFCEHASLCNYLEKQTRERIENEHKTKLSKE
jgi:hypothetical protein